MILLLNPPKHRLMNADVSYFPLNLGAIAASLEQNNIEVKIYNAELEDSDRLSVYPMSFVQATDLQKKLEALDFDSPTFKRVLDEFSGVLLHYKPDIVGITCMSGDFLIARHLARKIKEISPECVTVMGGSHVSALPRESLTDGIDFILVGPADNTFVQLINMIRDGAKNRDQYKSIKGICFKDGDGIFLNPDRDQPDLRKLPIPARHSLLYSERIKPNAYAHVMVSRGCPFSCNFCSVHTIQEFTLSYRPVESVIAEIKELLYRYGVNFVQFQDSIFNVNQAWVADFCKAVKQDRLKFKWSINCHVNTLAQREAQLDMMLDAGLDLVVVGLEVDRDELWRRIKKNIREANIYKLIDMLKRKNVKSTVNMIYGFPFDDEENFKRRNEFLLKLDPQHIAANLLQPLPGTELFPEWVAKNNLDPAKINYMALTTQSTTNNYTDIPYERFLELVREAYSVVDYINKKNQAYEEGFFYSQSSTRNNHISRPVGSLAK